MPKYPVLLIKLLCFTAFVWPLMAQTGDTNGVKPFVDYHTNGQVRTRGTLQNGVKSGLWTEYYPDGKKFREVHFKEDKLDGPFSIWFSDGKRSEGSFKAGKTDGLVRVWYSNDQLESEVDVVQDKADGKETKWYPNGQKRIEGINGNGNRVGHWVEWDERGVVIADGTYDDKGNPLEGSVRVRDPKTRKYEQLKVFKKGIEIKS
ncbi:MAG TPA: toxin-antitoxin system YwqK family antitoxin [Candidatus Cybelea sp.]|nr:toxin-antitoxin system YwqK family antitoxin [Candidatus Cybelea sp.]